MRERGERLREREKKGAAETTRNNTIFCLLCIFNSKQLCSDNGAVNRMLRFSHFVPV